MRNITLFFTVQSPEANHAKIHITFVIINLEGAIEVCNSIGVGQFSHTAINMCCGTRHGCTSLHLVRSAHTGPDGTVALSSAYGLVGTGFASRYRLPPRAGF